MVVQVSAGLLTLFSTNETVTMAHIHATIQGYLDRMDLAADTRMVLEAVFQIVIQELRAVIVETGVSDDNVTVYLHTIVTWVRDAALVHLVAPPVVPRVTR